MPPAGGTFHRLYEAKPPLGGFGGAEPPKNSGRSPYILSCIIIYYLAKDICISINYQCMVYVWSTLFYVWSTSFYVWSTSFYVRFTSFYVYPISFYVIV